MISYLFFLTVKFVLYSLIAAAVCAFILTLIPVALRVKMQNTDDDSDNVFFRISWLFSALVFAVSADVSGAYEYRLTVFGRNLVQKRDIFYDEEDL